MKLLIANRSLFLVISLLIYSQTGQIRDSNRPMLIAALKEYLPTGRPVDLGIAKDTMTELETAVKEALSKVDVLITTGGVSMGELDLIQPLLQKLGQVHFGRVLMKPGKPLTFATVEGILQSN
jgi:gephyrin